jgi:hypothetical protein
MIKKAEPPMLSFKFQMSFEISDLKFETSNHLDESAFILLILSVPGFLARRVESGRWIEVYSSA